MSLQVPSEVTSLFPASLINFSDYCITAETICEKIRDDLRLTAKSRLPQFPAGVPYVICKEDIHLARERVAEMLLPDSEAAYNDLFDMMVATHEAVINVDKEDVPGRYYLWRDGNRVCARVEDDGPGIQDFAGLRERLLRATIVPENHGRGFLMICLLASQVWIASDSHGTIVHIEKEITLVS